MEKKKSISEFVLLTCYYCGRYKFKTTLCPFNETGGSNYSGNQTHSLYWLNTELLNLETHFHKVHFQPVFIICNLHHLIQASANENVKMDDGKSVKLSN